jgi:23S rRNA A2030 N6-methylase RlmJ
MKDIFKKRVIVKQRTYKDGHKMTLISIHNKELSENLKKILNTEKKKSKTFVVPNFDSVEERRAFIAGIFDAEAHYSPSSCRIYFEITNKNAIEKIAKMIEDDGIKVCLYERKNKNSFRLEINGKNALRLLTLYPFIRLSL